MNRRLVIFLKSFSKYFQLLCDKINLNCFNFMFLVNKVKYQYYLCVFPVFKKSLGSNLVWTCNRIGSTGEKLIYAYFKFQLKQVDCGLWMPVRETRTAPPVRSTYNADSCKKVWRKRFGAGYKFVLHFSTQACHFAHILHMQISVSLI